MTKKKGMDELGVPYSEYPGCPNPDCKEPWRVNRNHIGEGGTIPIDEWYCYGCCCTFNS